MSNTEDYEKYRRQLRREGRVSYWTFLVFAVLGLAYALYRGIMSGFSGGEIPFIILFGLYALANALLLSPVYNQLADTLVRRRQRLRGDPVDPDEDAELRFGDNKGIDGVLRHGDRERGGGESRDD